jgi:hypothetical protein
MILQINKNNANNATIGINKCDNVNNMITKAPIKANIPAIPDKIPHPINFK